MLGAGRPPDTTLPPPLSIRRPGSGPAEVNGGLEGARGRGDPGRFPSLPSAAPRCPPPDVRPGLGAHDFQVLFTFLGQIFIAFGQRPHQHLPSTAWAPRSLWSKSRGRNGGRGSESVAPSDGTFTRALPAPGSPVQTLPRGAVARDRSFPGVLAVEPRDPCPGAVVAPGPARRAAPGQRRGGGGLGATACCLWARIHASPASVSPGTPWASNNTPVDLVTVGGGEAGEVCVPGTSFRGP